MFSLGITPNVLRGSAWSANRRSSYGLNVGLHYIDYITIKLSQDFIYCFWYYIQMVASWSTKRRFVLGGSFIFVAIFFIWLFFFNILYKAPTCLDGVKNGEETGVDCGGNCINLCTSDALNPIILWSKIFNISGDVYSAVAYIENPNINSKNIKATYQFSIFDGDGKLITVKDGETSIPKGKKFAVFETGIVLKGVKPKSTDFKFINFGPWERVLEKDPEISLKFSSLSSTSTVPRITGTIQNNSLQNISELELAVFVLDGNENVVAASHSFIDDLLKRSSQDFVFTWPKPFDLGVETCTFPLDVAIALDKSGSMKSEGSNPPEPFTTVITTAENFIKNFSTSDQISVISFGTISKQESQLSSDKNSALIAVRNLFLSTTTLEQTNITGGLTDAFSELQSSRGRVDSKKVIILLTDGIPTEPKQTGVPNYPVSSAMAIGSDIKSKGITLYTIGLGKDVDEGFLKSISTSDANYFFAPTKETLGNIYKQIGKNLCPKKPNVINVMYREIN